MHTFDQAWLYETVRRQELETVLPDESHINRVALGAATDPHGQLLARAQASAYATTVRIDQKAVRQSMRLAVAVLWFVSLLAGASLGLTTLGDGRGAVNVVWTLGALLLPATVMLLAWLVLMFGAASSGGLLGRCWALLVGWLLGKTGRAKTWQAWLASTAQAGSQRWWLAFISHTMWLWLMLGVLLSLLLAFSLRHYTFVWETTWLSESVFESAAQAVGYFPGLLGFSTPESQIIRDSGNAALTDPVSRKAWASWLVGAVLVFGFIPRLVLSALSFYMARTRERGWRISLVDAYAISLLAKLALLQRGQRTDGAAGAPDQVARLIGLPQDQAQAKAAWLALETEVPQSIRQAFNQASIEIPAADDRHARQEASARLQMLRPRHLLIMVDTRQTPDRGALRLLVRYGSQAHQTGVLMLHTDSGRARTAQWQGRLEEIGVADIFVDQQIAIQWLLGEPHD